jgi:hypothetical protein
VQREPGKIADYWTARRMRRAEPLEVVFSRSGTARSSAPGAVRATKQPKSHIDYTSSQVTNPEAEGNRTNGRVFAHSPIDGDYACSATAVDAANRSLVITAGHCVFDGKFATKWIFVPGYHDGLAPFGEWTAKQLLAPQGWVDSIDCNPPGPFEGCANFDYDLGAAVTATTAGGGGVEDAVGARGIAFNQPRNQTYHAYGYPAVPNLLVIPPRTALDFNGEKLWRCDSPYGGDDTADPRGGPAPMRIGCDMTSGSSGGGWVAGNAVEGLNSYGYSDQPTHGYGPYFGTAAECLYFDASGLEPPSADTRLLKHPKHKSRKRKANFKFTVAGGPGAYLACRQFSFQCRLDGDAWKDCSSGHVSYRKLKRRRKHVFRVRAVDVKGKAHGTPTKFSFKVKKKGG